MVAPSLSPAPPVQRQLSIWLVTVSPVCLKALPTHVRTHVGNLWIGVQPALGVEGDPMRLLFERDLTPHPQYAAFYRWIQQVGACVCFMYGAHSFGTQHMDAAAALQHLCVPT
jgi:hypothetical protein